MLITPESAVERIWLARTSAMARKEFFGRPHLLEPMTAILAEHRAQIVAELTAAAAAAPQANGKRAPKPDDNRNVIPPLPEWVTAYSKEIGYPMDGEAWCAAYEQKGWIVGRSKMKDWKAAVINWRTNRYGLGTKICLGGVVEPKPRDFSKF